MGSEPYVGWNWALICSEQYDLHVITRLHHRSSIAADIRSANIRFHYFDLPGFSGMDHRSRWMKPYYVVWQFLVFWKVLLLHWNFRFDIAHHVTYNNLDIPGFLWLLPKCHFVWGAIGGGQVPEAVFKGIYGKMWRKEIMRGWLKKFARFNPVVRLALHKASMVIFANDDTQKCFSEIKLNRACRMLETAVVASQIVDKVELPYVHDNGVIRLLWIGQLEPRKALVLALDVVSVLKKRGGKIYRLDVVGDGPDFAQMRQKISDCGLTDIVFLHGKVPFTDVNNFIGQADIFLFTSVQDTSGNVVLEAMCKGKPVVALHHQGVKEMLANGGGILVEITDYLGTVESFVTAIEKLASSKEERLRIGVEATKIIRAKFTWESKKITISNIYNEILS